MNDKEKRKIHKVKENFKYILRDFSQSELQDLEVRNQYVDYVLPQKLKIEPYIVFIIFVYLKQYKFYGKQEKIAWSFGLEYKNVPLVFSHQKFGFRVSVCNKLGLFNTYLQSSAFEVF